MTANRAGKSFWEFARMLAIAMTLEDGSPIFFATNTPKLTFKRWLRFLRKLEIAALHDVDNLQTQLPRGCTIKFVTLAQGLQQQQQIAQQQQQPNKGNSNHGTN